VQRDVEDEKYDEAIDVCNKQIKAKGKNPSLLYWRTGHP